MVAALTRGVWPLRTLASLRTPLTRSISTSSATNRTVALSYDRYPAESSGTLSNSGVQSVVLAHGLFGSKQNWRSVAREMAKRYSVPIYAVDLRNHGSSPQIDGMSYADMAQDLLRFLQEHQLDRTLLVGHSMGGKAALATALSPDLPADALSGLVSVDMAPSRGSLSSDFVAYLDALIAIRDARVKTRKQADEILSKTESVVGIRQFLLTNLERSGSDADWGFRIPLDILKRHLDQIGDFPYTSEDSAYDGPTLFIKGARSKYINNHNTSVCDALFPHHELVTLPTGHWVHAEAPQAFIDSIEKFALGN